VLRRIAVAFTLLAFGPATAHAVEYDEWTPAAAPLVVRSAPVTVALPDGRALVAGGSAPNADGEYLPVATAELYDPQANAWAPAAPMSTPRQGAAATVLADGRVLVAGGTVKPGYWDTVSAELYDPRTNTWSPAADMGYARMFHRAVALADGRVLVLGDVTNGNDPGASQLAEIYDPAADRWTGTTPMRSERGGFAVARMAGDTMVESKVGQRHVQGRTKAGGQSQQRFARRRDNQARQAYEAATEHAARVLGQRLTALVTGGDHVAVDAVLGDPRLARFPVVAPWLAVPDPRRGVLEQAVADACSVRMSVTNR